VFSGLFHARDGGDLLFCLCPLRRRLLRCVDRLVGLHELHRRSVFGFQRGIELLDLCLVRSRAVRFAGGVKCVYYVWGGAVLVGAWSDSLCQLFRVRRRSVLDNARVKRLRKLCHRLVPDTNGVNIVGELQRLSSRHVLVYVGHYRMYQLRGGAVRV
jgi:hypothetical protein